MSLKFGKTIRTLSLSQNYLVLIKKKSVAAALNPYQYSGHHNIRYPPGQGYNDHSFVQQQMSVNANRPNTFQGTMEKVDEEHVFTNLS